MSLHPQVIGPVPEETARNARLALNKENLCVRLREELGTIYEDEQFATLFPHRGRPAEAPWRLALVCVLQYSETPLRERRSTPTHMMGDANWKSPLREKSGHGVIPVFRARNTGMTPLCQ